MAYRLGVDLGTTYTAAAVLVDGASGGPEMLALGNRAMQVPSVLFVKEDGEVLVGEAAERRGVTEPARVVREFKRRVGDPVPLVVGGTPYSPQTFVGRLLRWVVDVATERRGEAPAHVTVTYPANWGPFKRDLLTQAVAMADLTDVDLCTEPEAAAITYAWRNRVGEGERVAVYDLGGGTFDAAVLERTAAGGSAGAESGSFRLVGAPEGIEHLGGIDFDEAVFQHVLGALGDGAGSLMTTDLPAVTSLSRLRRDCVDAKEALSADTETVIPVVLPGVNTSVRLTRGEFEDMVQPAIAETVAALRRVLRSSDTEPARLAAIVLVGGSSRIPLVSQLLSAEFGRPIALDTHPKHDVALGASLRSAGLTSAPASPARAPAAVPVPAPQPAPARTPGPQPAAAPARTPGPKPAAAATAAAAAAAVPSAAPAAAPPPAPPSARASQSARTVPTPPPDLPPAPPAKPPPPPAVVTSRRTAQTPEPPAEDLFADHAGSGATPTYPEGPGGPGGPGGFAAGRGRIIAAAGAVAAVAAVVALLVASPWSGDGTDPTGNGATPSPSASVETPAGALPRAATPLPDDVIVYPRQVSDDDWDLATVPAAGGEERRLTTGTTNDSFPIISDDRRTVIYVRRTGPTTAELRVIATDGNGDRALFESPMADCAFVSRPAWRAGSLVVPCRNPTTNISTLRVAKLDGTVVRTLDTGVLGDPSLSPDGKTVFYWRTPTPQDGGSLVRAAVDASEEPRAITEGGKQRDNDPAVSADGEHVAFTRVGTDNGIWTIAPDGGPAEQLTELEGDQDPTWSPDGSQIGFKRDNLLWVMNADGTKAARVTQQSEADTAAAWTSR